MVGGLDTQITWISPKTSRDGPTVFYTPKISAKYQTQKTRIDFARCSYGGRKRNYPQNGNISRPQSKLKPSLLFYYWVYHVANTITAIAPTRPCWPQADLDWLPSCPVGTWHDHSAIVKLGSHGMLYNDSHFVHVWNMYIVSLHVVGRVVSRIESGTLWDIRNGLLKGKIDRKP